MMRSSKYILSFLALVLVFNACSRVPITGRRQLRLLPATTMNQMSYTNYRDFLKQNKISTDAQQTALVKQVGTRIQHAVEKYFADHKMSKKLKDYNWEFNLVESSEANAWCMPGGKVVVYTGILPITQDETGLAVVLGHEISHAIANHGNERMSEGLLVQMGGVALSTAMINQPTQTRNLFMQAYGVGSNLGFLLPYSRAHESEADHMGLIFMSMAGYNPQRAVTFWQKMEEEFKNQQPPQFLSTHPSHETRIAQIKKWMPEALAYYHPDSK